MRKRARRCVVRAVSLVLIPPMCLYTVHESVASAVVHSSSSRALRARKLMPIVPNLAALEACGASLYTSPRHVIAKSTKPAAITVA